AGVSLLLPDVSPSVRRLAADRSLDRVKLADFLQGVGGDRRFRAFVDVEDLAPEVCPTSDLDDPFAIEFIEAGIGIGLQEATEPGQVLGRPFPLAVRGGE